MVGRGQQLDYSDLRNGLVPLPLGPLGDAADLRLAGSTTGNVSLRRPASPGGADDVIKPLGSVPLDWDLWVFFPGTRQMRNQKGGYKLKPELGEPMCLSLCNPLA